MLNPRNIFTKRFILTLSVCLLVLEGRARFYRGALFSTTTAQRRTYQLILNKCASTFDPNVGWKTDPGKSGLENIFGTRVTTESPGVRSTGRKPPLLNSAVPRILVTGDSYTFGDEVSDSETWPSYLEDLSSGKVFNAAGCGYDLTQMYLRSEELIPQIQATHLVIGLTRHTINRANQTNFESISQVSKPYFEIKNKDLNLRQVPVPYFGDEKFVESPLHQVLGRLYLADKVLNKLFPDLWQSPSKPKFGPIVTQDDPAKISCLILDQFKTLTDKYRVSLLVVAQYSYFISPPEEPQIEKVLTCAKNSGISVLDLKAPLVQTHLSSRKDYESLYIGGLSHMTPRGNHFVAENIHAHLTKKLALR